MKASRAGLLLLVLVSIQGCSHTLDYQRAVQRRAPFDLACSANQVRVQDLGNDTFGATGCHKRASYSCICKYHVFGKCTQPMCVLDQTMVPKK